MRWYVIDRDMRSGSTSFRVISECVDQVAAEIFAAGWSTTARALSREEAIGYPDLLKAVRAWGLGDDSEHQRWRDGLDEDIKDD